MSHDVFISYSSKDKPVADAVCATLEGTGVRCWIAPRDIVPGTEWGEAIIRALDDSRVLVLVFSANANASPQIRREVERAVHKEVPVIPMRIENVLPERSLEYFLSAPHWLDALTPPLEQHLERLTQTVKSLLLQGQGHPDGAAADTSAGVRREGRSPLRHRLPVALAVSAVLLAAVGVGLRLGHEDPQPHAHSRPVAPQGGPTGAAASSAGSPEPGTLEARRRPTDAPRSAPNSAAAATLPTTNGTAARTGGTGEGGLDAAEILARGLPQDEHPVVDLSRPMEEQVQVFAEDVVEIVGFSDRVDAVWLGKRWEVFDDGRRYVVWGVAGESITPKFRGEGEVKLRISYTRYRNLRRDLRGPRLITLPDGTEIEAVEGK